MNLRSHLVEDVGKYILDQYIDSVKGEADFTATSAEARKEIWSVVKDIILQTEDAVNVPGLSDGSISGRVDAVMQAVATGQIDIDQGKRLIEMLQAGFEITELKDLIAKLSSAGVDLE